MTSNTVNIPATKLKERFKAAQSLAVQYLANDKRMQEITKQMVLLAPSAVFASEEDVDKYVERKTGIEARFKILRDEFERLAEWQKCQNENRPGTLRDLLAGRHPDSITDEFGRESLAIDLEDYRIYTDRTGIKVKELDEEDKPGYDPKVADLARFTALMERAQSFAWTKGSDESPTAERIFQVAQLLATLGMEGRPSKVPGLLAKLLSGNHFPG